MKENRKIKLLVSYDGTAYHGFQRQANALTIQEVLEKRLARIFGHSLTVTGAGRTDAGVHAYGQVVHFLTTGSIPVAKIPLAAKSVLPADIVVLQAEIAAPEFHARKSAKSKIYVYRLYLHDLPSPFFRNYAWHVNRPLKIEVMHETAKLLVGTHDFSSFRAAGGEAVNPVRTILEASCRRREDMAEFMFWGTGFLYHMVRNLVGTLVDVGSGKITAGDFDRILKSRDRKQAGMTAPPQGLYLQKVLYDQTENNLAQ